MSGRGRRLIVASSLALLAAVAIVAWLAGPGRDHGSPPVAAAFICPMHPALVHDRPGSCPICGMDLVPASGPEDPPAPAGGEEAHAPAVATAPRPTPEGLARVRLSEAKARRIGARSVPAERARFEREVRAVGTVRVDETRLRQVHTKTAGWVERLWANAEGETVRAGQPLLEIYSPELLAAQEELLVALRASQRLGSSTFDDVAASGLALLEAARRRLRLLDFGDEEIAALEGRGQARRTVIVESPITGTILERGIAQGARVEPGTLLLTVADLSAVWILAAVYEHELPFVREGQAAWTSLAYLPGRELRGQVTRVYPTLDPATRTVSVRVELANPDGSIRPEMYAEVRLLGDLGERLSVPATAVMETGVRSVVFVDEGEGVFAPREIEIGLRAAERVEVLAGLGEGERVLVQGNFFVDSESRLRAALESAGHRH